MGFGISGSSSGGGGSGTVNSGTANQFAYYPTNGTAVSGTNTFSAAGSASFSPLMFNGALFTGGSGTTTFPYFFLQPSTATAATTWSTNGTFIGANAASGFSGNFMDFRVNGGTSLFSIA